jgi:hypothetical protein
MSSTKGKRSGAKRQKKKKQTPLDQLQPGMPALDSITSVETVRKGKKVLQIIHTNEVDAYESAPPKKQPRKAPARKHR